MQFAHLKKIIKNFKKLFFFSREFLKGFSIIEIIIVITIISVLSGLIIQISLTQRAKSLDSRIKSEINEIIKEMNIYYSEHGTYQGYSISSSFISFCPGSSYTFSTDGIKAVVYAKLCSKEKYWCGDSFGRRTELDSPPLAGVYSCENSEPKNEGGYCGGSCQGCQNLTNERDCLAYSGCKWLSEINKCYNYLCNAGNPTFSQCRTQCPSGCYWVPVRPAD